MPIDWLTTYPSGRAHTHGADDGQTGWKLHAVELPSENTKLSDLKRKRALCGCRPRTGWGSDLFIEAPCLRCVERAMKLGIDVPKNIMDEYESLRRHKDEFRAWRAEHPKK